MIINRLSIYGYGHLQNLVIEMRQPFLVLYGFNETGKTTIYSFIETMLFGFPKGQTNELRYEPKTGSIHGGKMELSIKNKGNVIIERVRGREPDESTIYWNDKRISERDLTELFEGMDRRLYRDLFSAQLEQLRAMESLDDKTLNRYLLGAGILGNFSLVNLENKLIKKQEEHFKPRGKIPLINKHLAMMQNLEQDIESSSGLKEKYVEKLTEKQEIETNLAVYESNKKKLQAKRHFYEKAIAVEPLLTEQQLVQMKLAKLPKHEHFPEDGIARYERLKIRILDFRSEVEEVDRKLELLTQRLPVVRNELLEYADEVQMKRDQAEVYRIKQENLLRLEAEAQHKNEAVMEVLEQLGSEWSPEKILTIEGNVAELQHIEQLVQDEKRIREQYNAMENELAIVRNRFKTYEWKAKNIQKQLCSDEERQRLEEELSEYDHSHIEQEKRYVKKIISHLNEQINQLSQPLSHMIIVSFTALIVSIAMLLLFFGHRLGFLFISVTGSIVTSFLVIHRKQRVRTLQNLHTLKKREEEKLSLLSNTPSKEKIEKNHMVRTRLEKDNEKRREWKMFNQFSEQARVEYANLSKNYEQLENDWKEKQQALKNWAKQRNFPTSLTGDQLFQHFIQVCSAKKNVRAILKDKQEMVELRTWMDQYEQSVRNLAATFSLSEDKNNSVLVLLRKIEARLALEKQKLYEKNLVEKQMAEETERLESIKIKIDAYEQEITELFRRASCETEEEFYSKGKMAIEVETLQDRLTLIENQLKLQVPDQQELEKLAASISESTIELDQQMADIDHQLNQIAELEKDSHKRLAEIQIALKELHMGGTYDEQLQKFEMMRSELNSYARDWTVYTVALDVLQKTKERYRKQRLPQTVQLATAYFNKMTGGRYVQIQMPVAGEDMMVISRDGIRYLPKELSRGTQEQLFLSLRFALAAVYSSAIKYPLLLDDLLIHFDRHRLRNAFDVIREQSKHHQIILFTCHEHIATHFHKEEVVKIDGDLVTQSHSN